MESASSSLQAGRNAFAKAVKSGSSMRWSGNDPWKFATALLAATESTTDNIVIPIGMRSTMADLIGLANPNCSRSACSEFAAPKGPQIHPGSVHADRHHRVKRKLPSLIEQE